MYIDQLYEYIIFTKHLNITHAARELNMSHANLSKHLRQVESDVGVSLVNRGTHLTLTPAGIHFLNKARTILEIYNSAIEQCHEIAETNPDPIIIRQPTYHDQGAAKFYELLEEFKAGYPDIPIHFTATQKAGPLELIKSQRVDAHIYYVNAANTNTAQEFDAQGLLAFPLCIEEIIGYCRDDSPLISKGCVTPKDLEITPLMKSQVYSPFGQAVLDYCNEHGATPIYEYLDIRSLLELMLNEESNALRILPQSVEGDTQAIKSSRMSTIHFSPRIETQAYLVMNANPRCKSVEIFKAFLESKQPCGMA